MNKTKIDWADSTWNPVTGCLNDCPYCYAKKISERFSGVKWFEDFDVYGKTLVYETKSNGENHELFEREITGDSDKYSTASYPWGFDPTFHRYRLDEPAQKKKPQNIFVCSMADLFGDWVPMSWIEDVLTACYKAPWHNYLFLTKNPKRYDDAVDFLGQRIACQDDPAPMWFGATATDNSQLAEAYDSFAVWLSIEPIREEMWTDEYFVSFRNFDSMEYKRWQWVIIGAETGNRKSKVIPKKEWIDTIVDVCRDFGTPVFMKESLRELMGDDFKQEMPEGLKR